jgi:hypothetical protein
MSEKYKLQRFRGKFALVDAAGKRHRHALETSDALKAKSIAPAIFVELTRPKDKLVKTLWDAYEKVLPQDETAGDISAKASFGKVALLQAGQ